VAKKYFFTIAFISWMVFITFSSLFSLDGVEVSKFNIPHLDKVAHFTFYFVACVLGVFLLRERTESKMNYKKAVLIMLAFTIAYGILMEVLQFSMTTQRSGDILDAIANTIGSFLGALATKLLFSAKSRLKWKL
jgi:VanZ family protein